MLDTTVILPAIIGVTSLDKMFGVLWAKMLCDCTETVHDILQCKPDLTVKAQRRHVIFLT